MGMSGEGSDRMRSWSLSQECDTSAFREQQTEGKPQSFSTARPASASFTAYR